MRKMSPKEQGATEIVFDENTLTEKLLGNDSSFERKTIKIHGSVFGRAEQWFYEVFDARFMP